MWTCQCSYKRLLIWHQIKHTHAVCCNNNSWLRWISLPLFSEPERTAVSALIVQFSDVPWLYLGSSLQINFTLSTMTCSMHAYKEREYKICAAACSVFTLTLFHNEDCSACSAAVYLCDHSRHLGWHEETDRLSGWSSAGFDQQRTWWDRRYVK